MPRFFRSRLSAAGLAALLALAPAVVPAAAQAADVAAEPTDVAGLMELLKQTYSGVTSFEASFSQVQKSAVSGEFKAKGKVQVKQPRKARWETLGETGSLFVTDGKTMTVYTPSMKQALVYEDLGAAASGGNVDVLALLEDISKLEEQFEVSMTVGGGGKGAYEVVAVPRTPGNYKRILLTFSRKKVELQKVVFEDQMGGRTELAFANLKLNADIGDDRFVFTPPPGTQIVQNGGL
jgi:outer membrane lipoprotein carrier protein